MPLDDLRRRTQIRSQRQEIGDKIVDPEYKEDVERLFDRPGLVSDLETLLDDEMLGGTEVLTISEEMPPVSTVRHVVRPSLRRKIEKMLKDGDGNFTIKPTPEIRVTTTVGYPGVRVSPSGTRSVTIEYVPGPRGNTAAATDVIDEIQESLSDYTYLLVVDGIRYPILDIDGAVLELGRDPEFSGSRHGLIYNGADRFLLVATRTRSLEGDSVKERRSKGEVRNLQERPIPLIKTTSLPGIHEVNVVAKNDQDTLEYKAEEEFDVEVPPTPSVGEVFYVFGRPERDALGKNKLNESLTRLGVAASINHPESGSAIILGARYRVATKSSDEWKYGEEGFVRVRPEALRWQMQDLEKGDDDTLGVVFPLGEYSSGHDRRVELKFLDELGRVVKREVVEKDAINPQEGQLIIHRSLPDRFGRFVDGSSIPLRTDVRSFYDEADAQIEDLKAKAESIIKNKTVEEIPVEEFQPPNARLKLEAVGGRSVEAQGAQTGHPNGLSVQYRFAWGESSEWDGGFAGPSRVYTFDESGKRSVTMQVRDEVDATDEVAKTIILPKPVLGFDFAAVDTDGDDNPDTSDSKTLNVDVSQSIFKQGMEPSYRYAYQFWDEESTYAAGETVYYEPNETIYKANGDTTLGLAPPDSDGDDSNGNEWDEVAFGAGDNKAYFEYPSDAEGEKPVIVQAKDRRGAFGETIDEVYIPKVSVNFAVDEDDKLVVTKGENVPDDRDLEWRFDWDVDGTWDTGFFDSLPVRKDYSTVSDSNIAVQVQSPSGARDQDQFYIPKVSPALSISEVLSADEKRYKFDASGSTVTGTNVSLEYRFDFTGDGEWDTTWSSNASIEHSYSEDQIAEPVVQVRDTEVGVRRTATDTVVVYKLSPTIDEANVTVQPSNIVSDLEGNVFEYRYSWERDSNNDPQYGNWTQQGRETKQYPINFGALSRTIDVQIRRANESNPTVYTKTRTIYWPDVTTFNYTEAGLSIISISVDADVDANAPFSSSDLEWKIDFGEGEKTTSWVSESALPDAHTYGSEGYYSVAVYARSPSGATNAVFVSVNLSVVL